MKRVGRYEIQARIGQGAMAEVYRAYDPKIDRVLAIKVLKQEYCENPEYAKRFIREARAAGALSHPNIVTIYDVGDAAGYPYIAMELLAGDSLDNALLARGQFAIGTVIGIGQQLADALNYAHGMGIVHRQDSRFRDRARCRRRPRRRGRGRDDPNGSGPRHSPVYEP